MRFYEALGWPRTAASNEQIVWFRTADSYLGLFPEDELARDATVPQAAERPTFRGFTLAINVSSEEEADAAMEAARAAGAEVVKPLERTDWGGYSGYFADPDGHLWEIAHNPSFALTTEGRLEIR